MAVPAHARERLEHTDDMMKGRYGPNSRQTTGTGAGTEHNQIKKAAEQRRQPKK
jgi:hypothetical protein